MAAGQRNSFATLPETVRPLSQLHNPAAGTKRLLPAVDQNQAAATNEAGVDIPYCLISLAAKKPSMPPRSGHKPG